MISIILGLGAISFVIAWIGTFAMKRIAPKLNFVDKPGHRKIHYIPKPLGGGVAIFLGVAVPMAVGLILARMPWVQKPVDGVEAVSAAQAELATHLEGIREQTGAAVALLVAMTVMHVMGLKDDRKAMGPFSKLFVQLATATGLVVALDLRALTALDTILPMGYVASVVITVLWITAISNAFNFLDNMDGLSAGVAAVCTTAFLVTALSIGQWFVAAVLAMLLGGLIGFLCFNFPPATIFMGDSGSLVIGLVLGVMTIKTTYLPPDKALGAGWYAVFAPVIVLALPLYDLLVVSAIRISRGKSPFVGDTNHFSHRLVARGMSRRTAVLCLYLVTAATSVAAIILPQVETSSAALLIFVQTLLVLGVVMLLEQHPLPVDKKDPGAAMPTIAQTESEIRHSATVAEARSEA